MTIEELDALNRESTALIADAADDDDEDDDEEEEDGKRSIAAVMLKGEAFVTTFALPLNTTGGEDE